MNSSNASTVSEEELRDLLNNLLLMRRVQTLVVTAVILVIGIIGNLLVLAAYWNLLHKRKIKELKGRYFMPVLAIADLASVFVGGVFFLYTDFHRATFVSNFGCKFGMFFSFNTNTISILILLLITISRYMKVCLPHGKRMTLKWKRISLVIVIIVSTISCSPFLHFAGSVTKSVTLNNLTSIVNIPQAHIARNVSYHMCFATRSNNMSWKIYYNILFLVQVLNMLAMIVCYTRMGRVIQSRCQSKIETKIIEAPKPSKLSKTSTTDRQSEPDSTDIDTDVGDRDGVSAGPNSTLAVESSTQTGSSFPTSTAFNTNEVRRRSGRGRRRKAWKNARNRFSMMFVVIVIIYAVTNIPTFIFLYLFMESKAFRLYFTLKSGFEEYNLLLCLVRIHLINNIVNPFIYGYFDFAFKKEVKRICYSVVIKPARYIWTRGRNTASD